MRVVRTTYSKTAKWLHWLVALIVTGLIPVGVTMTNIKEGPLQDRLYVLHESFGVTALTLMLLRLAVRLRAGPAPAPFLTPLERLGAAVTHRGLYLLLILTPIFGWLALSAYGLGPAFFGLGHLPQLLSKDEPLSKLLFAIHKTGGFLILAFVLLHVAGVIRHAFVKRDELVWRILPRRWRTSPRQ